MDSAEEVNLPEDEEHTEYALSLFDRKKKKVKTFVKTKKKRRAKVYTTFKCDICSKHFSDKYLLSSHKGIHATTRAFACGECEYTCKTRKYLARHVKLRHGGPPTHECTYCGRKFNTKEKVISHSRVHTGEKPYECGRCGKCFSARYSLQTHMYIHTNEKPFKCAYCPYACRDSSTLRKHQQRHQGIKSVYQCKTCGQEYTRKYALKNHVAEVHLLLDMKHHKCVDCGKMFRSKKLLGSHKRFVHEKSMQCKCELCGATIANKYNLKNHMRTHVSARPFKCKHEGCKKDFKDSSSLRKHEILHTPSQFYSCEICGRAFSRYMRLVRHLDVHTPRSKVECDYCGTKFLTKNYLAKHIRQKHSRKRQKYICDMCDFVTHNKPSIVMHIKYGHVRGLNIECKECGKKFKQAKRLNVHYLKFHGLRYKTTVPKPNVEVKIEPVDEEPPFDLSEIKQEIPDELTVQPEDILHDNEPTTDNDSEPPAKENQAKQLISSNSKHLRKVPEEVFDEYYIQKVEGQEKKIKHVPDPKLDEVAMKSLRKLIAETRQREELQTLERTRQQYNERMRAVLSSAARKKDKVNIKHFDPNKCLTKENINATKETVNEKCWNNEGPIEAEKHEHVAGKNISKDDDLNDKECVNYTPDDKIESSEEVIKNYDLNEKEHVNNSPDDKIESCEKMSSCGDLNKKQHVNNTPDDKIKSSEEMCKSDDFNKKQHYTPDYKIESSKEMSNDDDFNEKEHVYITPDDKIEDSEEMSKGDDFNEKQHVNNTPDDKIESSEEMFKGEKLNEIEPVKENDEIGIKSDDKNSLSKKRDITFKSESEKKKYKKNYKIKFNSHQCYICFKLYETKEKLLDHCKEHFDVCNNIALKKCPLCEYVTKLNITRHLRLVHKVKIKIPYAQIKDKKDNSNGSRYYYEINNEKIKKIEIIPSVKNLNKMALIKIDSKKRETKNMMIAKTKLVRKGKEWIVEHEDVDISKTMNDHMLPEVCENDIFIREKKLKIGEVWSDKYVDRLKRLYKIMKKKGVKMLFPCEDCDKICQTAAALKLHARRHDSNAKPFKKKVWKHKLIQNAKGPVKNNKNNKRVNKNIEEEEVSLRVKQPKIPKTEDLLSHRLVKPKPIVNKHKCDPQLKEFYEKNIRGGNIEFWQFLKIFNKMDREKINDFKDLEQRTDFGVHLSVDDETDIVADTTNEVECVSKEDNVNIETKKAYNVTKETLKLNRIKNGMYKRVIRINKAEHRRRNALKDKLREKIAKEKATANSQSIICSS